MAPGNSQIQILKLVAGIGQVEAFGGQREVGDDGVGRGHRRAGQLTQDGSTILLRVMRALASISAGCTMVPHQPSTMPTPLRFS